MRLSVGAEREPDEPGMFSHTHTANPVTAATSTVNRRRRERSFREFSDTIGTLRGRPVVQQRPCEAKDGARIK